MPSDMSLTVSDFDPEHEALASTREINMDDEPDFAINTSTIDRAFPDFSQLSPSDEDEGQAEDEYSDHSLSMEMGRGAGKPRRVDDSRDSVMSFENSVRSSSPAVRVEYPTPQKQQPVRNSTRRAVSENLRKDAQLRRATQAQKEAMSPQVSKTQRDQKRRTLSDMHEKVRDSYDGSFLGDERPVQAPVHPRSTRFGNPNNSQEIAEAQQQHWRNPRKTSSAQNHPNNTMGDTMTRQSFLLPDLPNISELVSGVYEDGTPVFSRQQKMRSTRFVSPPHDATDVSVTRQHMPLDAVPIPDDEKALFVNLRLLQDKVSELQMFKSDAEKRLETYRAENAALKAGRSRHSDKYGGDDGEYRKGSKRLISDNQKLEAANVALQNQLDIADRKAQVQDAAVKRLNQDRESAISQLGVAYLENRELKTENEALRQKNSDLQSQLSRFSRGKAREQDTGDSEAVSSASEADDSQMYTERSGDMSRSTRDLTSKSAHSNTRNRRHMEPRSKISTQVDKEISRLEKERADEALFSLDVPTPKRTVTSKKIRSEAPRTESKGPRKQPNTSKQRVKRVVVEDVSGPVESTEQSKATSEMDDVTLLSVLDVSHRSKATPKSAIVNKSSFKENEISRLRRTLEEERKLRKQRRSSVPKDSTANETANSTRQSILKKSSLREPKASIPRPASATGDLTTRSVATTEGDESLVVPTAERPRRHSDHSVASVTSRTMRAPKEDMTSAFILPDITLSRADLAASKPSRLPESAQRALDDLARHNGKNCTVCKNVLTHDGECDHEPVKVPQPVPVSERMPEPSVHNPEPTMRPSQPPAVALANVLKALEDELSHLKMQLAGYQSAYHKLDASVGKRQRKSLMEKIETLLKEIDQKSDQIYALYDVLEDHKTGNRMTEREMEQTLESIGIDVTKSVDLDEESELPWEGIESTAELTGRA
ncbi:hypothetical protein N7532_009488 [Penicillium argentinense]|uniref:Cep57 centrosome microtubule-binding domain-containing protein n=1 Tax=Penicillium argentinense TaxID=1131581 RepID=A0A9W9EZL5_9EURO|nr:uncharacterized protein N7532_009488 [Penicillium argentinense]KAJ5090804.1 hypothetical protein N7532_009488 [Penicillium argentinense]